MLLGCSLHLTYMDKFVKGDIVKFINEANVCPDYLNNVENWKNGYPPQWDGVVFEKVLEQVENFKENSYSQSRVTITHIQILPQ